MKPPPRRNSKYWRDRAEEARVRAHKFTDPDARATMEDIVSRYEAMAKCAEEREKRGMGSAAAPTWST